MRREVFLVFLSPLLLVVVGAGALTIVRDAGRRARGGVTAGEPLIREVLHLVRTQYVTETDPEELSFGAAQGITRRLDRYCKVYDEDAWDAQQQADDGNYVGIGITPGVIGGRLVVLRVAPGGPASRAGLQDGDVIVGVDGRPVPADPDVRQLVRRIKGPRGTTVSLRLTGFHDDTERELPVERDVVSAQNAFGDMLEPDRGIGYLRIEAFRGNTRTFFEQEIRRLDLEGLRSLVLDLRGNRGGILDAAVAVADRFLKSGVIVTTIGRRLSERYPAAKSPSDLELPVVVLVDGRTASAAEVLAGALQDHGRAILVGERSFGKGVVQGVLKFRTAGGGIKLTTAHYVTPAGLCIERSLALPGGVGRRGGLLPEVVVPLTDEERARAYVLADRRRYLPFIREALAEGDGSATEGLADRQLEAAVALLTGRYTDRRVAGL